MKTIKSVLRFFKRLFIILILGWAAVAIGSNAFPKENNILMGISIILAIIVAMKFDSFSRKYFKF